MPVVWEKGTCSLLSRKHTTVLGQNDVACPAKRDLQGYTDNGLGNGRHCCYARHCILGPKSLGAAHYMLVPISTCVGRCDMGLTQ